MTVPLPSPCSNEEYERRMATAVRQALEDGYTHVAFGDLFLEDVRRYREERLEGTGLRPLFPLWGKSTLALAHKMIDAGLEAYLTCVDPRVLPRAFAGRCFDRELLAALPGSVDPCGERGEFHTCVVAGPMFGNRVDATPGAIVERDGFVFADLRRPGDPPQC
jgi:diphthamide synthase (EF-2-diphthine--ammonia ligase)